MKRLSLIFITNVKSQNLKRRGVNLACGRKKRRTDSLFIIYFLTGMIFIYNCSLVGKEKVVEHETMYALHDTVMMLEVKRCIEGE